MKTLTPLVLTLILSACSSTSNIRSTQKSPDVGNFTDHHRIIVNDSVYK
jgi:hypothetical protein